MLQVWRMIYWVRLWGKRFKLFSATSIIRRMSRFDIWSSVPRCYPEPNQRKSTKNYIILSRIFNQPQNITFLNYVSTQNVYMLLKIVLFCVCVSVCEWSVFKENSELKKTKFVSSFIWLNINTGVEELLLHKHTTEWCRQRPTW